MTDKYDINDLISNAVTQKPLEFNKAFNEILLDKINNAIENKKTELAQNMFNNEQEYDSDEEQYDDDEQDYDNSEEEVDG